MPDVFDQIASPTQPVGQPTQPVGQPKGDVFDQVAPQPDHAAGNYLRAHPGMDPYAVQQAFLAQQGRVALPGAVSPQQMTQQVAAQQGGLTHFGNAMGQAIAAPVQGAVGLVAPQTGAALRAENALQYGPQTGVGGFVGTQAGNLINAPMAMNPLGRMLSAAEAMGNKRADIAEEREAGQNVSGASELARVAGTGALDLGANVLGNKLGQKMFGGAAGGPVAATTKQIVQQFAKKFGQDAVTNEVIGHAQIAAQNLIDGRPVTEGMGKESLIAPLVQTAAFAVGHGTKPLMKRLQERNLGGKNVVSENQVAPVAAESGVRPTGEAADHRGIESRAAGVVAGPEGGQTSEESPVVLAKGETLGDRRGLESFERGTTQRMKTGEIKAEGDITPGERRVYDAVERAGQNPKPTEPLKMAQTEETPASTQHPARLENVDALTDWYKQHNPGEQTGDLIKSMAPHVPYVEAHVPVDQVKPLTAGEDIDRTKVEAMKGMTAEQRHDLGPAILGPDGEVFDGNHRAVAAKEAGDTHLRAYVPEDMVGKNGITAAGGAVPAEHTEESLLARHQEVEALKAANDPRADHAAAQLQSDLMAFGEKHGDDAMENVIEKMQPATKTVAKEPLAPSKLGSARKGAVALPTREDIAGPGSIYKEEVKPAIENAAKVTGGIWKSLKSWFPSETGASNRKMELIAGKHLNEATNAQQALARKMETARDAFDKMSDEDQIKFQQRQYENMPQATPELQKLSDEMFAEERNRRDTLIKMGKDAAKAWEDNHFSMLWKKPTGKLSDLVSRIRGGGSITGTKGFLKQRTEGGFQAKLDQGLVPRYTNPVEQSLATHAEWARFVAGERMMKEAAGSDLIRRYKDEHEVPAGWNEIPDRAKGPLAAWKPDDGTLYAPDAVNRLLDNITKPSLFQHGSIFNAMRAGINSVVQFKLGASLQHARNELREGFNVGVANALTNPSKAAFAKAFTNPLLAPTKGEHIAKLMLGEKASADPREAAIIKAMQGTTTAEADEAYRTQFERQAKRAWNQGGLQGLVRAGVRLAPALNEKLMKGVFGYVQHTKLTSHYDQLSSWMDKNPTATDAQVLDQSRQIADHLDNIHGLMNRNNLFWNRTAKDLLHMGLFSVTWNYGDARAVMGGAKDLLQVAAGKKGVDPKRVAYLGTMIGTALMTGAVKTYFNTGQPPQSAVDYVFPKTGRKDEQGRDVRENTGSYLGDMFEFTHHPVDTVMNKASFFTHAVNDLIQNKSRMGVKIRNEDDPAYKQAGQVLKYILKEGGMPISIANFGMRAGEEGGSFIDKYIEPFINREAPKEYSESAAEHDARARLGSMAEEGGRTQEEADKGQLISKLSAKARRGEEIDDEFQKAADKGVLTEHDYKNIQNRAKAPTGLAGLISRQGFKTHPDQLMQVWQKMTPAEKQEQGEDIYKIIAKSQALTPDQKDKYLDQIERETK